MKSSNYIKAFTAGVLLASPLLWVSCSDAWDEHYGTDEIAGMENQPGLYQTLLADPELANFCIALKGIGADRFLDSEISQKKYTLWAPANFTAEQADSVIKAYYLEQIEYMLTKGKELPDAENTAYTQFFHNQLALYAHPVSSATNKRIEMYNGKYMQLVGNGKETGMLQNVPFDAMKVCSNGVLYKSRDKQAFLPSIYEALNLPHAAIANAKLDSVWNFIHALDDEELDEEASLPGDVVDGKQVYLDSVTFKKNAFLDLYGYLQREDSFYWAVLPTNEVWKERYDKYKKYFNFHPTVAERVTNGMSIAEWNLKVACLWGSCFNMSASQRDNYHPADSLCNTHYYKSYNHYPRINVFYPEDQLLDGLDSLVCSNGKIFFDHKGNLNPAKTFLSRNDYYVYSSTYQEIEKKADGTDKMNTVIGTHQDFDTLSVDTLGEGRYLYELKVKKEYQYVDVSDPDGTKTEITFVLPQTLSGVYYNIYVVTAPYFTVSNGIITRLPQWFEIQKGVSNEKHEFFKKKEMLKNPNPITESSEYPGSEESKAAFLKLGKADGYVASAEKMDTILVAMAETFPYCAADNEAEVKLKFMSIGKNNDSEKLYTRHQRFHRIILVPFETKEEAERAANDIDALNDELQRKKWETAHGK